MVARVCNGCTAVFTVGAPRCPQCGSSDSHELGEETMAKVSKDGGPSYDPNEPEGSAEGLPPAGAIGGIIGEHGPEADVSPEAGSVIHSDDVPEGAEDEDTAAPGYEDSTVEELKDELRARDLPVSGTKAELVGRLTEADAAADDDTGAAES